METHGSAVWHGGIKDGKGAISTKSGALKPNFNSIKNKSI